MTSIAVTARSPMTLAISVTISMRTPRGDLCSVSGLKSNLITKRFSMPWSSLRRVCAVYYGDAVIGWHGQKPLEFTGIYTHTLMTLSLLRRIMTTVRRFWPLSALDDRSRR